MGRGGKLHDGFLSVRQVQAPFWDCSKNIDAIPDVRNYVCPVI